MRDHVSDCRRAISCGCPTGVLVLMTAAAVVAVVGLWPRLKEFL